MAQPKVILIVEDQSAMRAALREFVQDALPGYVVFDARDGAQAMELGVRYRPALVLMDVRLPDADGIELAARMRAMALSPAIIIVSSFSSPIYVEHAQAAGAHAYVIKDRLRTELIPAMAAALDITSTRSPHRGTPDESPSCESTATTSSRRRFAN